MSDNIVGIYTITNTVTNTVYVGQSHNIKRRWEHHRSDLRHNRSVNKHLQRSWNKHGEVAFEFKIIEECTVELLDEREQYWIKELDSKEHGFNQNYGGGGNRGYTMSENQRVNLSNALKGKKKSPEHVEKMRSNAIQWQKKNGNPRSKQIVCLNTGKVYPNSVAACDDLSIPRSHSSHIRECSRGLLAHSGSLDTGEKLVWRLHDDYIKMSEEEIAEAIKTGNTSKKMEHNPRARAVRCITTGEVFLPMKAGANKYGVSIANIGLCCKHRVKYIGKHPITGEKLVWEYVE